MAKRKTKAKQTTMNISMPVSVRNQVDVAVREGGFGNASEFIRHLLRVHRERVAPPWLEDKIEEGLKGPFEVADRKWWAERRAKLEASIKSRERKRRRSA
jgi:Arc/MetJ-type ribon-helix-helix transcriptional regulator